MSEKKDKQVTKVLDALASDPSKMTQMLGGNSETVVRGLLKDEKLSDEEVTGITRQVEGNNVMKLFLGADGQIDAKDLMKLTGGFTAAPTEATRASGIGALLDGKLDANDLLAVMSLMNGNSNSQQTASPNLLSALFNSTTQPAQQAQPSNGLFSLLGGQPAQQAQPQQSQASGLGSLLGALAGQQPQQAAQPQQTQQQASGLGSLLGMLGGQQPQQAQQTIQTQTAEGMTVTLSGMQLAQIMQMFTSEQLKITQDQAKQSITLNADQLKQTIAKLGGKVQTKSKQTVTLTGRQLAAIMLMLGTGTLNITQAQMDQQITLNASQMNQLITSLSANQKPASSKPAQNKPAQNKPAQAQTQAQNKPEGYGQVFSFGGGQQAQPQASSASSQDMSSLINLASLLLGGKK